MKAGLAAAVMAAEAEREEAEADLAEEEAEILKEGLLKCTRLYAPSAEENVKFHSGQQETSQFIAVIVSTKTEIQTGIILAQGTERGHFHQVEKFLQHSSTRLMQNLTR